MVNPLIGIHAIVGELGVFAFLWVLVELINPTEQRIKRAKIAAILGVILFFMSWAVGGYNYIAFYSADVKPIIKEGPIPWAHSIFTETKEHVFLFLPFLSLLTLGLIYQHKDILTLNNDIKVSILLLSGFIVLIGLSMAGMGFLISTGAREALEFGVK